MNLNLFSLAGLFLSLSCFSLVFIILIYGKTKLHRIWALFNITVGIWGLGAFWIGQAPTESLALIRWKIAHIGIIFIPIMKGKAQLLLSSYLRGRGGKLRDGGEEYFSCRR